MSPSLFLRSHRFVEQHLSQDNTLLNSILNSFTVMSSSWRRSTSPSSSQEPQSPVSTPATTPTGSSPPPLPPPPPAPAPSAPERPVPGAFRYMPPRTDFKCSQKEPGEPDGHPVLILPHEGLAPELVRVLFATTKDVVGSCNAKSWGCNFLPLEGQLHPWREAIPLALGSFQKDTSINVSSVYEVRWRDLVLLNSSSVDRPDLRLSAETVDKVVEFVKRPKADIKTPWKIRAPVTNSTAPSKVSVAPASLAMLDPVLPTAPAPPVRDSLPVSVAVLAPVLTQVAIQKYVVPALRHPTAYSEPWRGPWRVGC